MCYLSNHITTRYTEATIWGTIATPYQPRKKQWDIFVRKCLWYFEGLKCLFIFICLSLTWGRDMRTAHTLHPLSLMHLSQASQKQTFFTLTQPEKSTAETHSVSTLLQPRHHLYSGIGPTVTWPFTRPTFASCKYCRKHVVLVSMPRTQMWFKATVARLEKLYTMVAKAIQPD